METRPYIYLGATYYLATKLLVSRTAMRAALWAIVIAGGIKAGQGLLLFMSVRHLSARPDAVLGHEEALFFSLFFLLTALPSGCSSSGGRYAPRQPGLAPVVSGRRPCQYAPCGLARARGWAAHPR